MKVNDIFNQDTLNIFVDASITKNNDSYIGCPGCVCVNTHPNYVSYIKDSSYNVIYESTNNNSEISAVLLGINKALLYRNNYKVINLFSDSKICIHGLKYWMFNWIENMTKDKLYSSSGQLVSNQEIFLNIVNYIIKNNLYINLYHQKGHVTSSNESIENAIRVFKETNYIKDDVDKELIIQLSYYNNYVDLMTKNILNNLRLQKVVSPFTYKLNKSEFKQKYKKLLGGE